MEYDRHILNWNNVMRTSWKLINRELGSIVKIVDSIYYILMVGVLQIIKLLPIAIMITLQLSLLQCQ